jgi:transposase InsO family protein
MTQRERDRLVVLKKAQKKLIRQRQAAEELKLSERQVRRLLRKLKKSGDRAVIHGLRGGRSNRRLTEQMREKAVRILSQEVYCGFGPTLASEYLASKHKLGIGREALRQLMLGAGLWRGRRQRNVEVHQWRARRDSRGDLVQWDTCEHNWLEGRGEKLYLIHMIDDATSELTARFVRHDSTEENMRLLWSYLEHNGRPVAFYTDKASIFQTAPKKNHLLPDEPLPPTQIGRALRELGIGWIAAHSPQAKGRIERSFLTSQDRLVKGLRVAGVTTLERANQYLEQEFVPWWNQHLVVVAANPTDAHRPLDGSHDLAAALSRVEARQIANDYTFRFQGRLYQIVTEQIRPGFRGAQVRVEAGLDGSLRVRFQEQYLCFQECQPQPKASPLKSQPASRRKAPPPPSAAWRQGQSGIARRGGMPLWKAAEINRTRTPDVLE